MNKKGILFTITTFLLLWSLVIINMAYVNRNNELQNLVLTSASGDKLRYIEDDVFDDVLYDLINVIFNSTRDSDNISFYINGFSLSDSIDHEMILHDYADYITGNYSQLNNIQIGLTNFSSSFKIDLYDYDIIINSTEFSSKTTQPEQLNAISLEIIVNKSAAQVITNTTPMDGGNKTINVHIADGEGNTILSDGTSLLDPSDTNDPFRVTFSGNSSIEVQYGDHLGSDGSFSISANNLNVNITMLKITFQDTQEELRVTAGQININITDKTISKQGEVLLFSE